MLILHRVIHPEVTKGNMRDLSETFAKSSALGLAIGGVAGWRANTSEAGDAVAGWVQNFVGWPIDAISAVSQLLGQGEAFQVAHDWLLGPALPLTAGTIAWMSASTALSIPIRARPLVDYILPAAPAILDPELEKPGVDPIDARAPERPFLAREEEMRYLMRFAGNTSGDGPAFMALHGLEGLGKTRLGLEWLKRLRKTGWDVGMLEPQTTVQDIERAHFRRKTAILIDDPGKIANFWSVLDALLSKKQRLRILLADQLLIQRPDSLTDAKQARIDGAEKSALMLEKLDSGTISRLSPELSARARAAADGRPLWALLGENPQAEITRRAVRRMEIATSEGSLRALALGALAGPLAHEKRREIPEIATDIRVLQRLYGGESRTILRNGLPAIRPEMLADEIVMRFATGRPMADFMALFEAAAKANPESVELRLASLWRRGENDPERQDVLAAMRMAFDQQFPERGEAARLEADRLANALGSEIPVDAEGHPDFHNYDTYGDKLMTIADRRPLDPAIRLKEALGAVNAIDQYGMAGRFDDLERWGERLTELARDFPQDQDIRLLEFLGAHNALLSYDRTNERESIDRWSDHFVKLFNKKRDDLDFIDFIINMCGSLTENTSNEIIALTVYKVVNFIINNKVIYKLSHEKVETIFTIFGCISNIFSRNSNMKLSIQCQKKIVKYSRKYMTSSIVMGTKSGGYGNLISIYGRKQLFDDLERVGALMIEVGHTFPGDARVRGPEAKGIVGAMFTYGNAGRFDDLERWGLRLTDVVRAFPDHADIRLEEAIGAFNAIYGYGKAGRFDDLERWGLRLTDVVRAFPDHADIRLEEANCAVNAIYGYGNAGRFDDLERWGERLTELARAFPDHADIRLEEVRGAVTAINKYGTAGRLDDRKRWYARLAHAAGDCPGHSDIQALASEYDVGYVSQSMRGWPALSEETGLERARAVS